MSRPERSLEGKAAVVSGSALGLGAAIVRELSRRGASVAINYPFPSERSNAERLAKELGPSAKYTIIEADMSTVDGPRILADKTAEAFGKIDIVVNCAGINRPMSLDDPDENKVHATWEAIANTNGRGTFLLTRAALRHLSREDSRIIIIGSGASRVPDSNSSIYSGSKGMLESYTRCWATELPRKYGCTVNGIAPGLTGTETFLAMPSEMIATLQPEIDATPVAPRLGRPEEIGWTVATLCEKGAGWMNGLYISVSGGAQMF